MVAKLIYLKNYDGDINKITINDKLMIYDHKINSFKEACVNAAQKQWNLCKNELLSISDVYTKEKTILLLKMDYQKYFGKSGNRKLLRDNKKLYLSLYNYTSNLDSLNKNLNKFSMRLHILINNIDIYCHEHKCIKFWTFNKNYFYIVCNECAPKYPSIEWFKKTYGIEWKIMVNRRKEKLSKLKVCSLDWFQNKYGNAVGKEKYYENVYVKMQNISNLKANRYSKISQDLFWKIYHNLSNKSNIYFHDINNEYVERIPKKYNYCGSVMMLDFKQNKKIIEYNGNYWHNNEKDEMRYHILKEIGYEIMIVTSDEYNRSNMSKIIIDKCVNFLQ